MKEPKSYSIGPDVLNKSITSEQDTSSLCYPTASKKYS